MSLSTLILQGAKSCYARISGTSAAVPFVAGTAALIASMPNAPKGKNAGVAIKALILRHADKKVRHQMPGTHTR
jgi:subtilisin family serine protease